MDLALILTTVVGVLLEMSGFIEDVPSRFMVTHDWSYGEMFNYAKWLTISLLCLFSWRLTGSALFAGFGVSFVVLLFDDMLQLHERMGAAAVSHFEIVPVLGLRAQDFGELLAWGMLGAVVLAALALGFRFARRQDLGVGLALLATMVGLVFCGAVVDMIAVFVSGQLGAGSVKTLVVWSLHLVEDGGEMVFGSLAMAISVAAFAALRSEPDVPPLVLGSPAFGVGGI